MDELEAGVVRGDDLRAPRDVPGQNVEADVVTSEVGLADKARGETAVAAADVEDRCGVGHARPAQLACELACSVDELSVVLAHEAEPLRGNRDPSLPGDLGGGAHWLGLGWSRAQGAGDGSR